MLLLSINFILFLLFIIIFSFLLTTTTHQNKVTQQQTKKQTTNKQQRSTNIICVGVWRATRASCLDTDRATVEAGHTLLPAVDPEYFISDGKI